MKERSTVPITDGSLFKNILRFSLPLMASNLLQVLFNMSDIAVIGSFSGPIALGSVGSTATLITLYTGFLIGLSGGINVIAARHLGAKDDNAVRSTVTTSFAISLAFGLFLAAIGLLTSHPFLVLLRTKTELIDGATVYLRIYLTGMPAMALYNFGNAVLSAHGDTKRPLFILTGAGILNVLLNLFFVIVLRLEVVGVALASVISQYVSAFLILYILTKETGAVKLTVHRSALNKRIGSRILSLGIPSGFQNSVFAIANLFIQSAVNTLTVTEVEGNSAAMNADAIVYDLMAAVYLACSTFMSRNYGAGQKKRVRDSYLISLLYSFCVGLIAGGGLVLLGRPFLSLFTQDEAVIQSGLIRLTVMGVSYCISAFMDCTIAASRGLGKSLVPTVIVVLGSCVFRVVWVYTVFAHYHTMLSLYLLYCFSWTITSIAELIYFFFLYRKQIRSLPS